ncbi:MAG: DotU family type IV/VI secretion system protein [Deltaproteobacteria bacterium]|nr:DotU family type IV/VI secretion system protein [Deltaproteobacteria bacterium]
MNLTELTKELFDYIVQFRQRAREAALPDITVVAKEFQAIFTKMDTLAQRHASLRSEYHQVKYPLVALADETVLRSDWMEAGNWEHYLLENKYFSSNVAGNQFFRLLENADQLSVEVLKIFFYCLSFGFSGAFSPEDPSLFRLRGRLYQRIESEEEISAERLFPDAYRVNLGQATKLKRLWRWWHIAVALVLVFTLQVLIESTVVWPIILGDVADNVDTAKSITAGRQIANAENEGLAASEVSSYVIRLGVFLNEVDAQELCRKVTGVTGQCKIMRATEPGQQGKYYVITGHFFSIEKAAQKFESIKSSLSIRSDSGIIESGKVPGECISGC